MITTEKTQLSSKEYFKIILTVYLKKKWWLIAWIWLVAIVVFISDKKDSLSNFLIIFFGIYPFIIILQYWRYANSMENKIFFVERYYEIYESEIIAILSDGSQSSIKLDKFIKVINLKNVYLLYISKMQFICIPKNCFRNEQDKDWFEKVVIRKI